MTGEKQKQNLVSKKYANADGKHSRHALSAKLDKGLLGFENRRSASDASGAP